MSIETQLKSLHEATRTLARAAEAADAELIERAIVDRGRAAENLASRLAELSPAERARISARIASDADDALQALALLAHVSREGLALLRRRAGAMRGYANAGDAPSALDRAT